MLCLVAQSCLTLCDPMDYNLPGSSVHGDFPGKNAGVGCQALDLPNPGIKPRCPTLQMDSLLAELPGKPMLCLCLCANIDSREATHLEVGWIPGRRHTLKFSDRPLLSKVEVLFTIPQTQTPPLAPNRGMFTFLLIQSIKKAECQNI